MKRKKITRLACIQVASHTSCYVTEVSEITLKCRITQKVNQQHSLPNAVRKSFLLLVPFGEMESLFVYNPIELKNK